MPEEHPLLLRNILETDSYHPDDIEEVLTTCWELVRVEVCPLNGRKKQLYWGYIVPMWGY